MNLPQWLKSSKRIICEQNVLLEYMDQELEKATEHYEARIAVLQKRDIQVVLLPPLLAKITESKKVEVKDFHAFRIPLSHPATFSSAPDMPFNEYVILTRRKYSDEFVFSTVQLQLDDGLVTMGHTAKAWYLNIGWIKLDLDQEIPLLYCAFTVADVQVILDAVIDSNFITSIKEEVLARIVLNLKNNYRKHDDEVFTANTFREAAETRAILLDKEVQANLGRLNDETEEQLPGIRVKPSQLILASAGWLVAIILIGVLL